jgi:hypothetical protein
MENKPIFTESSFLWDGNKHLSGNLVLTTDALIFHLNNFKETNLNLKISLKEIQEVKIFKLFEFASNGLIILDKTGRTNMFVMENPRKLKKEITHFMSLH